MRADVLTCAPDDALQSIEEQMLGRHKSHVVVVDGERRPLAMLSLADVAEAEPSARATALVEMLMNRASSGAPESFHR
jgi:CBS domain-containing protein